MIGKLYLFFLPIVNAFNFSSKITFPVIITLIGLIQIIFKKLSLTIFSKFLFIFLVYTFFSLFINIEHINEKMINHELAITTSIFCFYFIALNIIKELGFDLIIKILFLSYIVAMLFAIFEFIDKNILFSNISSLIPRSGRLEYEPTFFGLYYRARSFFEESGHYASFMAVLLPFIYLFVKEHNYIYKIVFFIFFILTTFSIFSVALYMFLSLTLVIFYILRSIKNKKMIFYFLCFLSILFYILIIYNNDILSFYHEAFVSKFNSISYYDRLTKTNNTLSLFSNSSALNLLFGYGMGSYMYLGIDPAINVYVNILRDLGIVGLVFFISIFLYAFIYIYKFVKLKYRGYFIFSLIMVLLFFSSISNYFYPHFWITFVLMQHKEVLK